MYDLVLALAFLFWIVAVVYTLISVIYPLRLYKSRKRAAFLGIPTMLCLMLVLAGLVPEQEISAQLTSKPPTVSVDRKKDASRNFESEIETTPKNKKLVAGENSKYDPKFASEATGYTIQQLNDRQKRFVERAAAAKISMDWCEFNGHNRPIELMEAFGVHKHDFKLERKKIEKAIVNFIEANFGWREFCGAAIFQLYGPDGELFGQNGEYPDREPFIRRPVVNKQMTEAQLEAEIELNAADLVGYRCIDGFTRLAPIATQKYKAKHKLDDEWYEAIGLDQVNEILNEATIRIGPEGLTNCEAQLRKYKALFP